MATAANRGTKTEAALAQQSERPASLAPGSSAVVAAANTSMIFKAETREMFASMASMVPTSEGDGADRIVWAILNATSWDELDKPWQTGSTDELIGVEIAVDSITRHASSYADGLGVFLVVHGHRVDTSDEVVYASGSASVVAQLVRAYALSAFPLYTILRKSDRPTERGYYPHHLEVLASSGAAPVEA